VACKRGLAGLAALGSIFVTGLLAGSTVGPVATAAKQIAPADVVALRFPEDWMNQDETTGTAQAEAPAAATGSFMLASAGDIRLDAGMLFSPRPMPIVAPIAVTPEPDAVATVAVAAVVMPEPKVEAKAETRPSTKPETKPEPKTAAAPTRAIAAATPQQHTVVAAATPPQHKPAAKKKGSGELFNEAQLASIKTRLKLSDSQEQYWPPVENALRAIGNAVARNNTTAPKPTALGYANESSRLASQIDPDSNEVQQLKSAAFPLIMSMNDDQKQLVRNIAHVLGLERVASSF
jgi:hypothetical protein